MANDYLAVAQVTQFLRGMFSLIIRTSIFVRLRLQNGPWAKTKILIKEALSEHFFDFSTLKKASLDTIKEISNAVINSSIYTFHSEEKRILFCTYL